MVCNRHKRGRIFKVRSQSGAALILIMFILGLAIAAYTIKTFTAASMQTRQDEETMKALGEAKTALIAWSVGHPNWPGIMPFPDRAETTHPNYDGESDCVTSGLNLSHLIGKLPSLSDAPCISPQDGLGIDVRDSAGEHLWYAVSMNLIRTNGSDSTPIINPGIINAPTHQWLRVLDRNGNLISDRVAAVIIAPGLPLGNQDRSGTAPSVSQFLDSLKIGANTYSNQDYDSDDEDFIMADDSAKLSDSDTTYQRPYNFNDKLVYITIDELMAALEKRVAAEVKVQLNNYYVASAPVPADRFYPYAAPIGSNKYYSCKTGTVKGFLPLDLSPSSCNYQYQGSGIDLPPLLFRKYEVSASCSFDYVSKVIFTRAIGSDYEEGNDVGACTSSGKTCTCIGAGACSASGEPTFTCNASGACTSEADKSNKNSTYTAIGSHFISNGACNAECNAGEGYKVSCTGANAGTVGIFTDTCSDNPVSSLPAWFRTNGWQDYVFYAASPRGGPPTLQVGPKSSVSALIITTGQAINLSPFAASTGSPGFAQLRPSCELHDYLDSTVNADNDTTYEATYNQKKLNYNDQLFIVAP